MSNVYTEAQKQTKRETILAAALHVAVKPGGWITLNRAKIARQGNCSPSLVSHYLGTMRHVRRAIMKRAVAENLQEIIEQSRAAHDGYAPKN